MQLTSLTHTKFIAEIGINHNGDMNNVYRLIDLAHEAGAWCVKFQMRTPELCVPEHMRRTPRETPWGTIPYIEYKGRIELSMADYEAIDLYCKKLGILWTASVWDVKSLIRLLRYDVPFIKIPSAMLSNNSLISLAMESNKPIYFSTGMHTEEEVRKAIRLLKKPGNVAFFCNSAYPPKPWDLNLQGIEVLKSMTPHFMGIGYSDHTLSHIPSIMAIGMGAQFIERHITFDKRAWGSDHEVSLDAHDLIDFMDQLRMADMVLGEPKITCTEDELKIRQRLA